MLHSHTQIVLWRFVYDEIAQQIVDDWARYVAAGYADMMLLPDTRNWATAGAWLYAVQKANDALGVQP